MTTTGVDLIEEVPAAFLQLSETERPFYSPSLSGELHTGPSETLEARVAIAALTNLVHAVSKSAEAYHQALSWRNFKVGSTAIMTDVNQGYMAYVDGFNVKPDSGKSGLNIHAEQMAISKGRKLGLNRVVGISVFAEPNDEDANPDGKPTLTPCNRCADMFEAIPEVDDRTLILGSNPELDVCELYTFGNLVNRDSKPLVGLPFSLKTEDDLEHYDRNIKVNLTTRIYQLYS